MPVINQRDRRGSLHVAVDVEVPTKLSRKAKKLLAELEEELASSRAAPTQVSSGSSS